MSKPNVRERIKELFDASKIKEARKEFGKAIIGQEEIFNFLLTAILVNGHVMSDGNPGTAKTRSILTLGRTTGIEVTKVQLTGDMTPDQIKGFEMPVPVISVGDVSSKLRQTKEKIAELAQSDTCLTAETVMQTIVREGPLVGAQLFLCDEANRGNEETTNSFLSVMQEGYFRVGDKIFNVHDLFTLMATRNFIEIAGIRPLGYAFMDRFIFSTLAEYPETEEDECKIIAQPRELESIDVQRVYQPEDFISPRIFARRNAFIRANDPIAQYIARLVRATRPGPNNRFIGRIEKKIGKKVSCGASTRTSQLFAQAAAVYVYCVLGEDIILPEHIQYLAKPCLRHHLKLENAMEQESMISANRYIEELVKMVPIR